METSKFFSLLAYRFFGNFIVPYENSKSFAVLALNLKKARIQMILAEYLSAILLVSILLFTLSLPLFYFILSFVMLLPAVPAILFTVLLAFLLGIVGIVVGWVYPSGEISGRASKIESEMPYAVAHMATIAGTGSPPETIFRLLARFKEFKEVSTECEEVVRDFEIKGYSFVTAVEEVAGRTPSDLFKDLLWGMVTTIRTGGNLSHYLFQKSKSLMESRRREGKSFIGTLSLFDEIYIITFVLGPLLTIVMVLTMSLIGSKYLPIPPRLIMQLLIYVIVPLGSIGSLYVLKQLRPLEG
ncbi:MAG: hypothetical protein GOV15_01735 [Candidatus Diapherotrites archaeon]|nr:hypothetical protein [Candidatus Diapherotrites archaeon]